MAQSKATRLLVALNNGAELTAKQIASRFNSGNPYELVRTLRNEGYNIELFTSVNSKRQVRRKYAMAD